MDILAKIPGKEFTYADYAKWWAWRNKNNGGGDGYGAELHTLSNAAADPNGTEADATTGFGPSGLDAGANVFASQSSVKDVGNYSIEANANDTPTALCRFVIDLSLAPFNLVNGDEVRLKFNARHVGLGGIWQFKYGGAVGLAGDIILILNNSDTSFQAVESIFTYDADHKYFGAREVSSSNDGGVYFDNFSVKKKL